MIATTLHKGDCREGCVLVAPVEATSSFLRGSLRGPEAVESELRGLEHFDAELGDVCGHFPTIHSVVLPAENRRIPDALGAIEAETARQLEEGRFVLMLGGEHTVSLGPLRALQGRVPEFGIVQLDAHGDLRESYEGRRISHACVMRRAVEELGVALLGLGIRSICQEEAEFIEGNSRISHLNGRQATDAPERFGELLDTLPEHVYLTIDMDVFDPTVAPGVGTPEAGGLDWHHVSAFIDLIAQRKKIVGADIVELAPTVERERTVRLAARVALRVLLHCLGSRPEPHHLVPTGV